MRASPLPTSSGNCTPAGTAIRPIRLPEERDRFAGLSVATFSPSAPWEATRAFWGEYVTGLPYFRPGHWLGAFAGDEYLGGVAVYQRTLRVGVARVPLACIASLAVRPEYRRLGVGTALIGAAEALALDRGDSTILLHGIPGFYRELAYSDVLDVGGIRVTRQALAGVDGQIALRVRPAAPDDAPALLGLFERHFGSRVGAFDRDPRIQRYFLDWRIRDGCPVVASDSDGIIRGYVIFQWSRKPWGVNEVVAEDWPAALAILRHVAHLQDARGEPTADIVLPCSRDSTLNMAIVDHIWATYETEHDADAGWMAKPTDARRLCDLLGPELRRRWLASGQLTTPVALSVDGARVSLGFPDAGDTSSPEEADAITGANLVQLVFGYRPATWIAARSAGSIGTAGLNALSTLFPPVDAWIAGTDAF